MYFTPSFPAAAAAARAFGRGGERRGEEGRGGWGVKRRTARGSEGERGNGGDGDRGGGWVRGVIAKEVVEEEGLSRGLACSAPLQRPCLHRTAGSRATWEGAFTKVERAKAPLAYRRRRRRQRREGRTVCSECLTSPRSAAPYSPHEPASRDGRLQLALC